MWIMFIVIAMIMLIFWRVSVTLIKKKNDNDSELLTVLNNVVIPDATFVSMQSFTSPDSRKKIAIDEVRKKFSITVLHDGEEGGLYSTSKVYEYKDILSVEILENEITTATVSRKSKSSEIDRGVTVNPTPATQINTVNITIVVNDIETPVHTINFVEKQRSNRNRPIALGSDVYKFFMERVHHWYGLLESAIQNTEGLSKEEKSIILTKTESVDKTTRKKFILKQSEGMKEQGVKQYNKPIFIGAIALFLVVSLVLILDSGNEEIKNYQNAINSDETLNDYFVNEATIGRQSSMTLENHTFVSYMVSADVNDKFLQLNDEQKYELFLKVIDVMKKESYSYQNISCGKKETCSIEYFQFVHEKDVYEYKRLPLKDYYSLLVNGEELYNRAPTENKTVSNTNQETETTVDNKSGNDWNTLNENEKYHAVSNALYNLDQQGYSILEGEYYYIEALDAFYTDSTTSSVEVSTALSQIGQLSGSIFK